MTSRVECLEHAIKDALQEADFIGRMCCCQLGDGIIGGVYKGVYTLSGGLVVGATDFEVEG